jgi:hypothetical protein
MDGATTRLRHDVDRARSGDRYPARDPIPPGPDDDAAWLAPIGGLIDDMPRLEPIGRLPDLRLAPAAEPDLDQRWLLPAIIGLVFLFGAMAALVLDWLA